MPPSKQKCGHWHCFEHKRLGYCCQCEIARLKAALAEAERKMTALRKALDHA